MTRWKFCYNNTSGPAVKSPSCRAEAHSLSAATATARGETRQLTYTASWAYTYCSHILQAIGNRKLEERIRRWN